ncbi:MAG: hypothetical protein K1X88_16495 [Nannocystaceae bacterium]|nr:hypothetical protein [Nannocystaceae bacterium]
MRTAALRLVLACIPLACAHDDGGDDGGGSSSDGGSEGGSSTASTTASSTTAGTTATTTAGTTATTTATTDEGSSTAADSSSSDGSSSGGGTVCGDGVADGDEACDDGDTVDGNGCNNDCTPSLAVRWAAAWDGPAALLDTSSDVAFAPDGRVGISGRTTAAVGSDMFVVVYDELGTMLWQQTLDGEGADETQSNYDDARGLAFLSDGDVVVVGSDWGVMGTSVRVTRLDDTGAAVWTRREDDTFYGGAVEVAVSADDELYVIGGAFGDAWMGHLSAAGALLPSEFVPGLLWVAIAAVPGGGIEVGGMVGPDAAARYYDADLTAGDTIEYAGPDTDVVFGVAVDGTGNLSVLLYQTDYVDESWTLHRYAPDGTLAWSQPDPMAAGVAVYALAAAPDQSVVVAGIDNTQDEPLRLRRFDAEGTPIGEGGFAPAAEGYVQIGGITIDTDGTVAVSGGAFPMTGGDAWVTVLSP